MVGIRGELRTLKRMGKKKVKKIYLLGEAKEKMADFFRGSGEVTMVRDLKEAVALASREAYSGDAVLFSPACSSFDMFKDYAERGDKFTQLVKAL